LENKKKRKFYMPTAYSILFLLIIVVAIATWIIPAGSYEYIDEVPQAGTYHSIEQNPQGIGAVLQAPFKGFYDAVDVCIFILMVGGFLGIVMKTGAIDAGIGAVIKKLNGREKWLIPILMLIFGLGGTSYGMWEETMAFYPLLIPVFLAAGYDAVVAVSVVLLGAGVGVICSTVNPFATGIASGFAGVSLGEGIVLRILQWIVFEAVAIWFVMSYAAKVKRDPKASVISLAPTEIEATEQEVKTFTKKHKTIMYVFGLTFLVMIYGVIPFDEMGLPLPALGWWFPELSALFLVSGLVIAVIARLKEQEITETFVAGCADLLGVAFIIGISRGITVIMNEGAITDTVLYWGEQALTGTGSVIFVLLVYLLYLPLSILIPSSSGLATLSVPIIAPLAGFAGVGADLVVTAFQSASGVINLITPTAAVLMGALTIGHIPFDRWIKYIWKLILYLMLLTVAFLAVGVIIG